MPIPVFAILPIAKIILAFVIKKGIVMFTISSIFSSAASPATKIGVKIAGYLFVALLSLGTVYGIYSAIKSHFTKAEQIQQLQAALNTSKKELEILKESNKVSADEVIRLNNKLKSYNSTRVKEKKAVSDKIKTIEDSPESDIVKTNQKLDIYYDDIFQIYCKMKTSNCEVSK